MVDEQITKNKTKSNSQKTNNQTKQIKQKKQNQIKLSIQILNN